MCIRDRDEAEQKAKIDREQANELEYVDVSQKSEAAECANASNGSAGAKPVRNPEREKPKWEDTLSLIHIYLSAALTTLLIHPYADILITPSSCLLYTS